MDEPSFKVHPAARHEQARQVGRYDFCAPGPMSPPNFVDRPEQWAAFRDAFKTFDEPKNHPQRATLSDLLSAYGDREDVIFESHVGGGPPDWDGAPTPRERLVEIASGHGAFEWILQDALAHGYRPAVIGSTDAHLPTVGAPMSAHAFRGRFQRVLNIRDARFGSGPLAAIWSDACSRHAIREAIDRRTTYATTGARILLRVHVNGVEAGGEATVQGAPEVALRVNACAPIQRVDLIRNDRCIRSWQPDELDVELAFTDTSPVREGAYYVRLRQDGEYAWSTPVWVTCPGGGIEADPDQPAWNADEPFDLSTARPNDAEAYEVALRTYLESEEDPDRFRDITPIGLVEETTGRSALFLSYLVPENIPVSIRWYYEFEMPRIHLDWGWRDFGMRRSI